MERLGSAFERRAGEARMLGSIDVMGRWPLWKWATATSTKRRRLAVFFPPH